MITDAFLFLVWAVIEVLMIFIKNLPDVTLNAGVGGAINTASVYLKSLDIILPIDIILIIISLILGIELILATYKVIMWVIRRIPTQS